MPTPAATHLLEYLVGCGEQQTDGTVVVPFGQAELARRVGRSRGTVGDHLRTFGRGIRSDGACIRIAPDVYATTGTDSPRPDASSMAVKANVTAPSHQDDTDIVASMASWIVANPAHHAVESVATAIAAITSTAGRRSSPAQNEHPRDLARVVDLDAARPAARQAARDAARQERPDQKVDNPDLVSSQLDSDTMPRGVPRDLARELSGAQDEAVPAPTRRWSDDDLERWIRRLSSAAAAAGLPAPVRQPRWRPGLVERLAPYSAAQIDHAVSRLAQQLGSANNQITNPFGVLCAQAQAADPSYFPPSVARAAAEPNVSAPSAGSLVVGPELTLRSDDEPAPLPPDWAIRQVDELDDATVAELDRDILENNPHLARWPSLRERFPWRLERARVLASRR